VTFFVYSVTKNIDNIENLFAIFFLLEEIQEDFVVRRLLKSIILYLACIQACWSLTLTDTMRETIASNPDILVTEKDHHAIQEALEQAKAPYFPKLNVHFGYGPDVNENSNTIATSNPEPLMPKREAGITLDQNIFEGFATQSDVARNSARVSSAVYKVISTVEDTMERDTEVYLGVLREQELLKLAQNNLAFHEKIVHMIELRAESGVSRKADLYQANARLSLARANLLAEVSNLSDSKANFYRTVGVQPELLILPSFPDRRYLPSSKEQAIEIAVRNNPVVKSAEADIYATIEQHNAAKANNYPHLDLQLSDELDRNVGGQRGPSFERSAILRLSYNLFNGGADIGRQRETAFQIEEAKQIRLHAIRQLVEAVKLTWDLYVTAKAQLSMLKDHVNESERTVGAYEKQYQIGQRTLLDLLDSQNELFAAQRAYVGGRYDLLQSSYRILRDEGISIVALNMEHSLTDSSYVNAARKITFNPHQSEQKQFTSQLTEVKLAQTVDNVPAPFSTIGTKRITVSMSKTNFPPHKIIKPTESSTRLANALKRVNSGWAVQIGSFSIRQNATKIADKLRAAGYKVFTREIKTAQGNIQTHVYIGPELQQANAIKLSSEVNQRLALRGFVLPISETQNELA